MMIEMADLDLQSQESKLASYLGHLKPETAEAAHHASLCLAEVYLT